MEKNQNIEELFQSAFANHEVEVSARVWQGVQSSMAMSATGAAASTGTGFAMIKSAAVVGIATIVAVGTINETAQVQNAPASDDSVAVQVEEPAVTEAEENAAFEPVETAESASSERETAPAVPSTETQETTVAERPASDEVEAIAANETQEKSEHQDAPEPVDPSAEGTQTEPAKDATNTPEVAANMESSEEAQPTSQEPATETAEAKREEIKDATNEAENDQPEELTSSAHIPKQINFISPDGDGTNDCFSLTNVQGIDPNNFRIEIHTKSGQPVFQSTDVNFEWCGTDMAGNQLPNKTTCFYQILATDYQGLRSLTAGTKGSITVFTGR